MGFLPLQIEAPKHKKSIKSITLPPYPGYPPYRFHLFSLANQILIHPIRGFSENIAKKFPEKICLNFGRCTHVRFVMDFFLAICRLPRIPRIGRQSACNYLCFYNTP